jgi:hypothetical protein
MKFNNYINESTDLITFLEKNVEKSFIDTIKKTTYLFRGTSTFIDDFKIIQPRKDRRPKDMPERVHKILDAKFKEKFGWNVRSEGVFTTSDRWLTDLHDDIKDVPYITYIFFPIKKFQFVWSKSVDDLYNVLQRKTKPKVKNHNYRKNYVDEVEEADLIEIVDELLQTYTSGNLTKAIQSESEVVFKCDSYVLINMKINLDLLNNWLNKDPNEITQLFK